MRTYGKLTVNDKGCLTFPIYFRWSLLKSHSAALTVYSFWPEYKYVSKITWDI